MLMAVPITMMLKVVLEGSDEFRWISVAISADHVPGAAAKELLTAVPKPTEPALVDRSDLPAS
jgi:hypothetical protein